MTLLKPTACEPAVWHDMMEVAKFLTELAVIDYHFAPLKPSSVGLAALMTAMEGVAEERLAMVDKENFATNVYHIAQVSPNDTEVMDCRTRLRSMYYEGVIYEEQQIAEAAAAAQATPERIPGAERIFTESPTGVDAHPAVQVDVNMANKPTAPKNEVGSWGPDTVATEAAFGRQATKANDTSGASSSSSALEAPTIKGKETKTKNDIEDEVPASTCTTCTIANKAKKLVQDAFYSNQKTKGTKKRRKN